MLLVNARAPAHLIEPQGRSIAQATGRLSAALDACRSAGEWDAAHLSVLGYLNGATRPLTVDAETATVIAGWAPDSTIWLTDVAHESGGPRQAWHRASHGDPWTLAP